MAYEVGSTVLALRDGDEKTLNVYGEGVYVGDMPTEDPTVIPADVRQAIEERITADDAFPIEQHPYVNLIHSYLENLQVDQATYETAIARIEAQRALPFEQRVNEYYRDMLLNPCIYLDSGDIVWGMQCWWGDKAATLARFPDAEIVTVPVPEGNGRWK